MTTLLVSNGVLFTNAGGTPVLDVPLFPQPITNLTTALTLQAGIDLAVTSTSAVVTVVPGSSVTIKPALPTSPTVTVAMAKTNGAIRPRPSPLG